MQRLPLARSLRCGRLLWGWALMARMTPARAVDVMTKTMGLGSEAWRRLLGVVAGSKGRAQGYGVERCVVWITNVLRGSQGVNILLCCSELWRLMKKWVTIQFKSASGGPAGGQTFEKFDKQVLKNGHSQPLNQRRMCVDPRNEGKRTSATCSQGGTPCRRRQFFRRLRASLLCWGAIGQECG